MQVLKRYLARLCQLFLSTFSDFSDSLLAISAIRQLVAWALAPVCKETFLKGLTPPNKNMYADTSLDWTSARQKQFLEP